MKCILALMLLLAIWNVELKNCHKLCYCIVWLNRVGCSGLNLSRLPDGIPTDYTNMDLSRNNISSLLSGDFQRAALLQLKSLDMSSCKITIVEKGAFDGMDLLETLNLKYNYIQILHSNIFCGATSLSVVFLASNLIQAVEPNAFCEIKALKALSLENNSINELEHKMFKSLTGLTGLSLRHNNIAHIPEDGFKDLRNLTFLDLGYNNISTITKASLVQMENLYALYMPNNFLHCDCQLKHTFQWFTEHGAIVASCYTPMKVANQPWQIMLYICNSTAFQASTISPDVASVQQAKGSVMVSTFIVFAGLTVLLAVIIVLYRSYVKYVQRQPHLLNTGMSTVSLNTKYTTSTL